MKKYLIIVILFCISACIKHKGNLNGTVSWKYNEYVGFRADVGSAVYLFSKNNDALPYQTKVDLMGNFKFENIPTGNYLLIIISENSSNKESETLKYLAQNSFYLKDYFHNKFYTVDSCYSANSEKFDLYDSLDIYSSNLSNSDYEKYRHLSLYLDTTSMNIISNLNDIGFPFIYNSRLYIEEVTIKKERTENVSVNFGYTYI